MAIIQASREFEGGDISANAYGRIIKEGVRQISFRDDKNRNGNYFFILPAYKVDNRGAGVWYRVISVRREFGIDKGRESYVPRNDDPINFFENKCRMFYPDFCVPQIVKNNGEERKIQPAFGKISKQLLYNAAYVNELQLGAHVIMLPAHYIGQSIESWCKSTDARGQLRPMLNDSTGATPIKLQIRPQGSVSGNPWLIEIDPSQRFPLPEQLADTDYLYNLDDVVHHYEDEYLINKLKSIVPNDIFEKCMTGHPLFVKSAYRGADLKPLAEQEAQPVQDEIPMTYAPAVKAAVAILTPPVRSAAPAFEFPKANVQAPSMHIPATAPAQAETSEAPKAVTSSFYNPAAAKSMESVKAYLNARKV